MEKVEVASLEAPIRITIPRKKIAEFKKELRQIEKALVAILGHLDKVGEVLPKAFKSMNKTSRKNIDNTKKVLENSKKVNAEQDKTHSKAKRTAKVYGAWADKLAQVRVALGLVRFALGQVLKLVAIPTAVFSGFTYMAARVNALTTEMSLLSKATGFELTTMRALGLAAKDLGFTFEHVKVLAEEWNNKISGEKSDFEENNLREGLVGIGIALEDVIKLKPEEAFERIMNAGREMVRNGKFAEFASAADKIYGQEAHVLLTALAQKMEETGQGFKEFVKGYAKFTTISKNAEKGAIAFTGAFNKVKEAISSVTMEFFGLVGERLDPFFGTFLKSFEDIKGNIGSVFGDVVDIVSMGFMEGTRLITDFFTWLRDNPDEVRKGLENLISTLKDMFELGVGLGKIIAALVPIFIPLVELALWFAKVLAYIANTEVGRYITQLVVILGTLLVILYKSSGLIKFLIVDLLGLATAGTTASGAMAALKTATTGMFASAISGAAKFLGALGLIAAAGYAGLKLGEFLDEKLGITDMISDDLSRSEVRAEDAKQAIMDQKLQGLLANFHKNQNAAKLQGASLSGSNDNSTSMVSNYNTNHVTVSHPETGREIVETIRAGSIS